MFLRLLTWWNSQTLGTQIFTMRRGIKVGSDEQGNIYYHNASDKRRWVIYNGYINIYGSYTRFSCTLIK